ncbi:MAG: TlpA family protein disulfide reductase [Anaerolineales bacterium]|nr:TlpA family protein disulfide reductase [Anaerolineales bacterium]
MMKKRISSSRIRVIALMTTGLGLLAIGVMFLMLFDQYPASTQDFSTVPAKVNFPAPELILKDIFGRQVSLADYRGSVVLVNLWATWCPPCREEMPTLQAFYQKYKEKGFVLVGIDQEESLDVVLPFVDEFGLTFPVWMDEKYEAQQKFNTMNLPSSYVIDRGGQVRLMWIGGISKKNLEKFVPDIILE